MSTSDSATATATLITQSSIIERGWTKAVIDRFLGDPDATKKNPKYACAAPMRLFDEARVEEAEATAEWQAWKQKLDARRANPNRKVTGAAKQAQERKQREQDRLNALVEEFRALSTQDGFLRENRPVERVHQAALNSYNSRQKAWLEERVQSGRMEWEPYYPVRMEDIEDGEFLSRIATNFLRHSRTPYDIFVEQVGRNEWRDDYASRLQAIANEVIAQRYPAL